MSSINTLPAPKMMLDALWPARDNQGLVRLAVLAVLGACLITVSAKFKVPFWPVPLTLQTLAILAIAAAGGRKVGVAAVLAYLAAGMAGLPVFANTPPQIAGPAYFMGPTAGFLIGFPVMAYIMGWAAERAPHKPLMIFGAGIVSHLVLMAMGMSWLFAMIPGMDNLDKLFSTVFVPTLAGNLVKSTLVAALMAVGSKYIIK
jgi:biotin transport system substrate-specific component